PPGMGEAERFGKVEAARMLVGKKYRHAVQEHCAGEPIHDRSEHFVEIGLRAHFPTELDQSAAVVITRAIEKLVELVLNPFSYRVEQQRGDDYRHNQAVRSGTGDAGGYEFSDSRHS